MPNTPPIPKRAARPPRIQINRHYPPGSGPTSAQPPFTNQTYMSGGIGTAGTGPGGQPIWPSNPFGGAGEFMSKGFDGFMDFTKTGMSFGERFTYGLYNKIYKWSRKWFTHIFLFLVVFLYTVGGALTFQSIEGRVVFVISTWRQEVCFSFGRSSGFFCVCCVFQLFMIWI